MIAADESLWYDESHVSPNERETETKFALLKLNQ